MKWRSTAVWSSTCAVLVFLKPLRTDAKLNRIFANHGAGGFNDAVHGYPFLIQFVASQLVLESSSPMTSW